MSPYTFYIKLFTTEAMYGNRVGNIKYISICITVFHFLATKQL
jgi:hypothetical protein